MIKVATYTGSSNDPSSRFRIRQYIGELKTSGIHLHDFRSVFGNYPPPKKALRPFWAGLNIAEHFVKSLASHNFDISILQREMLSTFYTCERFVKTPLVLDVDDSIFLHRKGKAARMIAQRADTIVCGNTFLADWFSQFNKRIEIIPTGIDLQKYFVASPKARDAKVIVWSGSSSGFKFLYDIEPALNTVINSENQIVLRIIADKRPDFKTLNQEKIEFIPWSIETEVINLNTAAIGIMPLHDDDWSRGKCSYKMLTYMACGIPVVVTPVGMNSDVLKLGNPGIGASTAEEWISALLLLASNDRLREYMGNSGRKIVEDNFSVAALAKKWSALLKKLVHE